MTGFRCYSRFAGLPVRSRFGLCPAKLPDGSPAPLEIAAEFDRSGLMRLAGSVTTVVVMLLS
jgi:hypothetical protein